MIDLKRLRDEPEYRRGIERKRVREGLIDEVLAADAAHRVLVQEVESLRARQNAASKEIGKAAPDERAGEDRSRRRAEGRAHGAGEGAAGRRTPRCASSRCRCRTRPTRRFPTVAKTTASPADASSATRRRARRSITPRSPRRWVSSTRPAPPEASGSRFAYIMREGALLEFALVNYAMSTIVRHGFIPVITPALVRERTMEEAGFFPTDRAQVYDVDDGELFLLGTSEVALSALHRAETFAPDATAGRATAATPRAFGARRARTARTRAASSACTSSTRSRCSRSASPEDSVDEHECILAIEEEIVGGLGLPYRVVNIAAGDLGPAAAKKFDIEAWLPSEGAYREITSCSNYTDYSARRLGTRVKGERGSELVHTLNGTAVRREPHVGVPVRALPTGRRQLRRPRRAAAVHRFHVPSPPPAYAPVASNLSEGCQSGRMGRS